MSILIPHTPFRIPDILLPNKSIDLYKWAVIACDQFTSSQKYWEEVQSIVGDAPSTLDLILPEIYLESNKLDEHFASITRNSKKYIQNKIFDSYKDCLLLLRRQSSRIADRWGIAVQVDLAKYDPDPTIENPIKSTEFIVANRLPKRIAMRKHSIFDLTHVLMLYEDEDNTLLNTLQSTVTKIAYKTSLMMNGGDINASFCEVKKAMPIISNFFKNKSNNSSASMFAVGDGNHSLMSAKQVWINSGANLESPERWALVELVNIFDNGLKIEPIHRVLFDVDIKQFESILTQIGTFEKIPTTRKIDAKIILRGETFAWISNNTNQLAIEQIEHIIQNNQELYKHIDFIHSEDDTQDLALKNKYNLGITFPSFEKSLIFQTVQDKKLFPRKSFSLGESEDKKYYIETCSRETL